MIADLHVVVGWICIFSNAFAGVLAGAAHWVESLRRRAMWVVVGVAQVTLFVEAILGVIRVNQLDGDPPGFHLFYGFLTLIAVGILYSYRPQVRQWQYLLYGGGSLFIMGLSIRALFLDEQTPAALVGIAF